MENKPFCFLNVFKPKGITSFDVIFKLRKKLGIKKIGHSGTLDPFAEGVMQVAAGNATRLIEYLNSDKEYIATAKFCYSSTTLDTEGEIKELPYKKISADEIKNIIKKFKGKIKQTPPKYSAIKVDGQKLCNLARKNPEKEIEIPEREVEIYDIELLNFEDNIAKIKIKCSKGTYIRTLASDIAKSLGTDAYLTELIRTKAGNFELKNSVKIEEIDLEKNKINPLEAINLKRYELNDNEYNLIKNGVSIKVGLIENNIFIMLSYKKHLVSIGYLSDNIIKVEKFFNLGGIIWIHL
mgnify:CR=1 FL=1